MFVRQGWHCLWLAARAANKRLIQESGVAVLAALASRNHQHGHAPAKDLEVLFVTSTLKPCKCQCAPPTSPASISWLSSNRFWLMRFCSSLKSSANREPPKKK